MRFPNPWQTGGLPFLNIAQTCAATHALGPGLRAVVWVQGCPFQCAGCIAPEWIPFLPARLIEPEEVVQELLVYNIDGLTFSGGEPMLQAAGLAKVARLARQSKPNLSVICYTGFTLEQLLREPPGPGVKELLDETDVLIDGLYISALNDDQGLRGSSNQRIHFLTDRLKGIDFVHCSRRVEIHVREGYVLLVGIPTRKALLGFQSAIEQAMIKLRGGASE